MAESYTNIKIILDKIMRHPLLQDLSLETVVDYTIEFMKIMGIPSMFTDKIEILNIENYRALLPCDFYTMNQVRDDKGKTFRYTTDSFHLSNDKYYNSYDLTYKIQNSIIYTSIEKGQIEISYQAIETDCEGYPLIPDNSNFTLALEFYIKKRHFGILFDTGKVTQQVLQKAEQDYAWAVGGCSYEFNKLSLDKAESFFNSWRTLLIRDSEHKTGFINNGTKEKIRIH